MTLTILAVSISGLIPALITFIFAALIFWLLWWLISYVGLPEPFNKVARVIIAIIAVIFVINFLMSLTGKGFINW